MSAARRTALMFWHEVRLVVGNRRLLLALFGIPLSMTALVNFALSEEGPAPDSLTIYDADHSEVSKRLADQLASWPGLEVRTVQAVDDPSAYVTEHQSEVLLVLPSGLQQAIVAGRRLQLPVYANRNTSTRAQTANLAIFNAGIEVQVLTSTASTARTQTGTADPNKAALDAVRTQQANYNIRRSRTSTSLIGERPLASFGRQARFATGEGIGLIEFVGLMLAFAMAHDREGGRLARLLWTRLRLSQLVVAKAASVFLFVAACMAGILAVSFAFGMDPGPSPGWLTVVTLAAAFAMTGYSMLILAIGHYAPHLVQLLGVISAAALSIFGGSLVPADNLPGAIRIFGQLTPNEWATEAYHALLQRGATGGSELLLPLLALLVIGTLQMFAGGGLLRYAMRHTH